MKNPQTNIPSAVSSPAAPVQRSTDQTDPSGRIASRAYEIWEAEGRRDGDHEAYWQRAEREMGSSQSPAQLDRQTSAHMEEGDEADPARREAGKTATGMQGDTKDGALTG
jgi:hypothetical protein